MRMTDYQLFTDAVADIIKIKRALLLLNLSVENDTLTISADMQSERSDEKAYYSERRVGHVSRSFNLEGIDQENITADYKNGILYVTLPKQEPVKAPGARRIAIGRGAEEAPKEQ